MRGPASRGIGAVPVQGGNFVLRRHRNVSERDIAGIPLAPSDRAGVDAGRRHGHILELLNVDVLELLEKDHKEAKALFKKVEAASGQQASRLWKQLSEELTLHEKREETHLYPQLRQDPKAHDIVLEGYEEHHVMDVLIEEIDKLSPSGEEWEPKMKVLQENTEHHIKEEEDELFPRVRKVWDADKRREVGEKMAAMKGEGTQKKAA